MALYFPDRSGCAWIIVWISLAGVCLCLLGHRSTLFLPLFLFTGLGYLSVHPWTSTVYPPDHLLQLDLQHPWQMEGTLRGYPVSDSNRTRLVLDLISVSRENIRHPVRGAVKITATGQTAVPLSRGDVLSISGKIRPIRNFTNPGGFDYRRYLRFQDIDGSVYVPAQHISIVSSTPPSGWTHRMDRAREHIATRIESVATGDERAVLKALLIGDRSEISPELTRRFARAGLSHVLAISGLHIGIVAGTAWFLFIRILSWSGFLLRHALVRKAGGILSIFPVLLYGFLAGMTPSTQRAVIMAVILLLTFLLERDQESFNTIAVAAFLILVIHPPSLFSISFQLSFASVLAIVAGISSLSSRSSDPPKWSLRKKITTPIWVSLLATAGTFPLVMYYMNQFSLVSPVANFVVVPIIGFGVVPLGLLSASLYAVFPPAGDWFLSVTRDLLHVILIPARFLGELPLASIHTVTPTPIQLVCYYVFLGCLYIWFSTRSLSAAETDVPQEKFIFPVIFRKRLIPVAGVVILLFLVDSGKMLAERLLHSDLRVTILDVGQGNSALVEFPKGPVMLIDGGGFPDHSAFDMGERVIAPLLGRKWIRTIDFLVLSHPDSDHLNGLVYIAGHFDIGEVWSNGDSTESPSFQKFIDIVQTKGISHPPFADLVSDRTINGTQVRILHPPPPTSGQAGPRPWKDRNNNSLVVSVRLGTVSILFPGDIQAEAETDLVNRQPDQLSSQVLIAPHHGSKTSSTIRFIETVNPETVVFSAAWNPGRKLPHPSVVKRYRLTGCRTYHTGENGAIRIRTDGENLEILPMIHREKGI